MKSKNFKALYNQRIFDPIRSYYKSKTYWIL